MLAELRLVNLIALLVGVGFLLNGYAILRRGREDVPLFVASVLLGFGLVFVALFQDSFYVVASVLGLDWKGRAILVVSNLTLFVVVTYLLHRIDALYDRLSQVNEELSLLKRQVEDGGDDP